MTELEFFRATMADAEDAVSDRGDPDAVDWAVSIPIDILRDMATDNRAIQAALSGDRDLAARYQRLVDVQRPTDAEWYAVYPEQAPEGWSFS